MLALMSKREQKGFIDSMAAVAKKQREMAWQFDSLAL
jgi:hypothetical protein